MFEILKLNKISPVINCLFDGKYALCDACENPDGIIVRSFNMAEYAIGNKLLAVARAGAGVNNIPLDRMTEKGVVVFNTPGANANAVKELTICSMLLASRDIIGGNKWVNTLTSDVEKATEKGKASFGGYEITGKTLGVIGLGAIGILVANACVALGMKVIGFDACLTEENKAKLSPEVKIADLDEVIAGSDILTLHVPLTDTTKNMINAAALEKMKKGVIIINMSRVQLVNAADLKKALSDGKVAKYVVDFPTEDVLNTENIIVIPHLGASTEEAEDNCAVMAAKQLTDYIENGNIVNSVNFPCLAKEWTKKYRTCILFKEGCETIGKIKADGKTAVKRGLGYAVFDSDEEIEIPECDAIIKVRKLSK